ncbi:MAG TPA: FadR/GntR family transcriptional regulator [Devosiaceae bacterium]|nr:FadR/GntR family transcriptional regulator [Devosiaceae bacterium]
MKKLHLTPAPKRRLADILYGQLLEQIINGVKVPGDKLPTESEICTAFGASRPVVREALMRLQADGLVESRRGSGTFVTHAPSPDVARLIEPADFASYLRVYEVRIALEPAAASLAASRRSLNDLADIRAAAKALGSALSSGPHGPELDLAFHRAIALASGNELFARQLDGLSVELAGFMGMALGLTRLGSAERRDTVLKEHQQIIDAIEMGDADLASTYMRFHLSQARRRLTDVTRQP